jgi:hypothetical protein
MIADRTPSSSMADMEEFWVLVVTNKQTGDICSTRIFVPGKSPAIRMHVVHPDDTPLTFDMAFYPWNGGTIDHGY